MNAEKAARPLTPVQQSSFAVVSNGFVGGGPAQALRDYLVARGADRVFTVFHPLNAFDGGVHELCRWDRGELVEVRQWNLPSRPPLTFPLDLFVPWTAPAVDCWFGFNALACWRGIRARRQRRVGKSVYWCVDFVRDRFGRGPLTWLYERMDGLCCTEADLRFDISARAADARAARHQGKRLAETRTVPIGAWLDRVPTTPSDGWRARKVVYLGNLVRTQGGPLLIEALGLLIGRGVEFTADIIGRGPLDRELRERARQLDPESRIHFHGFVEDDREVERILAGATVGVAAYDTEIESFTRWADPAKVKLYLATGLPIVLTDVPPNARELGEAGAAVIVPFSADAIADAIERLLADPGNWSWRREASMAMARGYDWNTILTDALAAAGYEG